MRTLLSSSGAVVNGTVRGGAGNDSLEFDGNLVSGVFAGDAGADFFTGSTSVGTSGVSFWGGSGNDTFSFSKSLVRAQQLALLTSGTRQALTY